MKNKYLIKILSIIITLAIPILAAGLEQSGVTVVSDILAAPTVISARYIPSKHEIAEIDKLRDDLASSKISRINTNSKLYIAASSGKQAMVEFLLNQKPTQKCINRALLFAVKKNQQAMVNALLNQELKPTQQGINKTFVLASRNDHHAIVEVLLNRPQTGN